MGGTWGSSSQRGYKRKSGYKGSKGYKGYKGGSVLGSGFWVLGSCAESATQRFDSSLSFCDPPIRPFFKQAYFRDLRCGKRIAPCRGMAGWKHFNEIAAWQQARELKKIAYGFLRKAQFRHEYKFKDQLKDAARSGPSNIAEGFGRHGNQEFARFVEIAKGSEAEVLNHFIDAHDQGLISDSEFQTGEHAARKAMKTAVGLIKHLRNNRPPT